MAKNTDLYVRNIVFGISDSLVSTVGLLSGIDVSGTSRQIIVLTGIVYAFVEAFSMAVGSFLSEQSTEEYDVKGEVPDGKPFLAGIVMFVSFILASFIPIVPYLFAGLTAALWTLHRTFNSGAFYCWPREREDRQSSYPETRY